MQGEFVPNLGAAAPDVAEAASRRTRRLVPFERGTDAVDRKAGHDLTPHVVQPVLVEEPTDLRTVGEPVAKARDEGLPGRVAPQMPIRVQTRRIQIFRLLGQVVKSQQ